MRRMCRAPYRSAAWRTRARTHARCATGLTCMVVRRRRLAAARTPAQPPTYAVTPDMGATARFWRRAGPRPGARRSGPRPATARTARDRCNRRQCHRRTWRRDRAARQRRCGPRARPRRARTLAPRARPGPRSVRLHSICSRMVRQPHSAGRRRQGFPQQTLPHTPLSPCKPRAVAPATASRVRCPLHCNLPCTARICGLGSGLQRQSPQVLAVKLRAAGRAAHRRA